MTTPASENGRSKWDVEPSDIATAASLLSRLPLRNAWVKPERMPQAVWAFPLVGAIIGAIAGLFYLAFSFFRMPCPGFVGDGLVCPRASDRSDA